MDVNNTLENLNISEGFGDVILTEAQKLAILKRWEQEPPPSIPELTGLTFPDLDKSMCDGRFRWAKTVKEFLIDKGITPVTVKEQVKRTIELNDAQKEYITNNCPTMKPLEMAKELFNNRRLSPASAEARAVILFFRTIDPKIIYGEEIPEPDYNPPKQVMHVLGRIRKYVSATKEWDQKKLSPAQKKSCETLINYLHDFRFKRQIDSYEKTEDKITFESEFIKYTYNKSDLEQEEISQYVALCSYVVTEFNIKQHIEMLQTMVEEEYAEHSRVNHALVQTLESARQDLNNVTLRQKQLYEALTEKRSEKLSKEMKDKESLLNLFNAWKNYESRQKLLKLRQKQKENIKKSIQEIENLDELKQRVLGLSIDEIIDG